MRGIVCVVHRYIKAVGAGSKRARDLDREEARAAMGLIVDGVARPEQVGAFLLALRMKGESAAELAGFVDALDARMRGGAGASVLERASSEVGRSGSAVRAAEEMRSAEAEDGVPTSSAESGAILPSRNDAHAASAILTSRNDAPPASAILPSRNDAHPVSAIFPSKNDAPPASAILPSRNDAHPAGAIAASTEYPHPSSAIPESGDVARPAARDTYPDAGDEVRSAARASRSGVEDDVNSATRDNGSGSKNEEREMRSRVGGVGHLWAGDSNSAASDIVNSWAAGDANATLARAPAGTLDVDCHGDGHAGRATLLPAAACAAAALGVPVLLRLQRDCPTARHGLVPSLAALGLDLARPLDAARAARALATSRLGVLDLDAYCPSLAQLVALRPLFGVRTVAQTLMKLLDPLRCDAQLVGVFHAPYLPSTAKALAARGRTRALCVQALGGLPEASPGKIVRVCAPGDDEPRVLDLRALAAVPAGEDEDGARLNRAALDGEPSAAGRAAAACALLMYAARGTDPLAAAAEARRVLESGAARAVAARLADG